MGSKFAPEPPTGPANESLQFAVHLYGHTDSGGLQTLVYESNGISPDACLGIRLVEIECERDFRKIVPFASQKAGIQVNRPYTTVIPLSVLEVSSVGLVGGRAVAIWNTNVEAHAFGCGILAIHLSLPLPDGSWVTVSPPFNFNDLPPIPFSIP